MILSLGLKNCKLSWPNVKQDGTFTYSSIMLGRASVRDHGYLFDKFQQDMALGKSN